jgi:hypothetical protein
MGLQPFGTDNFLKKIIRDKIKEIQVRATGVVLLLMVV